MVRKVLSENDCDHSIHTYVHLGRKKRDVPRGWALNLFDIREFIPVLRYEFECYIQINDIIAPCRIRINPRLFYSGTSLRRYLESEREKDKDRKIPLEIKFNKKELNTSLDEFDAVTMDYIDGIPAETRINMQTRLFYTSKELRQELERLSNIDPKQKVDARIILNEEYLDSIKKLKRGLKSKNQCVICGNFLDKDSKSIKCFDCLDKEITVLKLKKILDFFNPLETFYEEDLLDLGYTKGQINIFVYKFDKYDLISINWDGSFQLKDQTTLDNFINRWG